VKVSCLAVKRTNSLTLVCFHIVFLYKFISTLWYFNQRKSCPNYWTEMCGVAAIEIGESNCTLYYSVVVSDQGNCTVSVIKVKYSLSR
jgi:hypothetical protein